MAVIETYRPGPEGEDTSVYSNAPAVADGGQSTLAVGRFGSSEARAFMKFDVALKPGWDVVNSVLRIEVVDWNNSLDPVVFNVQAHRIGAAWDEDSTIWNDQPPVSGAALSQVDVSGVGTYTFPIADAVDAWNAGAANHGIRLAYAPGGDARWFSFGSSDASNPAVRPYIQVTWAAKAPNAPIVEVDGFPANETSVLSWRFSHDDPNAQQTAYQVEILRVSDSVVVLSQAKTVSPNQQITINAGTLENDVDYQVRVKTWGPEDVEGPWSPYDMFTTAARPTTAITSPTSGEVVFTSTYNVAWSYTGASPQAQYRLRLYEQPSNQLVTDSGVVNSALTTHPVTGLKDDTTYRVEVEVWNAAGIGSAVPATLNFAVDTVPPPTPNVTVTGDTEAGVVQVVITNPTAGVGQVATDHNQVWRRTVGGIWTRVSANVPVNGTFQDPSAAAGVAYEYRVVAHSGVGTVAETVRSVTLNLYGVWLHEPTDPMGTLTHLLFDGLNRDETWAPEVELMRFAGRQGAVAEFGPQASVDQVEANVQLASGDVDREALRALARKRVLVCYRDGQGRKVYGVITSLTVRDEKYGGSASFRVEAVDYIETGV